MELLKQKITDLSSVNSAASLDVSYFLNELVDPALMQAIGADFAQHFAHETFDAFITVESSGIAPSIFASLSAQKPLIIIKKRDELLDDTVFAQQACYSFTKDVSYYLTVRREKIAGKRLILLDDFLAHGNVVLNVDQLLKQQQAELVATGIVISKDFQAGRQKMQDANMKLYCQAGIASLDPLTQEIVFTEQ